MTKYFFIFSLLVSFSSCASKYEWLHLYEKKYCTIEGCCTSYVPINSRAFIDYEKIGYCSPFLFKADSIILVKDSTIQFYQKQIKIDVVQIKSKFLFNELRGFTGSNVGESQNSISFPVFITDKIDSTIQKLLIQELLNPDGSRHISILAKGSVRIIEIESKEEIIYIIEDWGWGLFIPRPLPLGEYKSPGCGISGDGELFIRRGLGFCPGLNFFFRAGEIENLYLKKEDIIKLYK
jgi:hypothetical protein